MRSDSASAAIGSSSTSGFNLLYHGASYLVTTNAAVAFPLLFPLLLYAPGTPQTIPTDNEALQNFYPSFRKPTPATTALNQT